MKHRSLTFRKNESLRRWTTLRVGGGAQYFCFIRSAIEIPDALAFAAARSLSVFVLGGGSNVLVSDEGYPGLVLHISTSGWTIESGEPNTVCVRVAAGVIWDSLVEYAVKNGWWGIENLSGIPGTVGAAPVQNIGAYGQEVSDAIVSVDTWDCEASTWRSLAHDDCQFSYRQSIFNTSAIDRYVITYVTFRLRRDNSPCRSHAAVGAWLDRHGDTNASIQDMRRCILALRGDGRLPDVCITGNVGSFFKHVLLDSSELKAMRERVSTFMGRSIADELYNLARRFQVGALYKLPAGILIRACGAIGWREGGAAQYENNPLVLVNSTGVATAQDVIRLANRIRDCVLEYAGIELKIEPRCIGWLNELNESVHES